MTTIEKIRAEILNTFLWEGQTEDTLNSSVRKCLEIIDKYAEQEPTIPCDLCGFNRDKYYFCEYLSECPAIGKGGVK